MPSAGALARVSPRRLRGRDRAGSEAQGQRARTVASKAAAVAATYLVEDDKPAVQVLLEAAKRADAATRDMPDDANAWYLQAFVLGRYAQRISIVKALAEGIGGKVRKALDRALELDSKHADAHIALGLYHAEIIDKVGALGKLTYGADAGASVKHFEQALKLNPGSAIAHMEYANGLLMLHGNAKRKQAVELYRKAAACKPADAMERLDVEQAKAELEWGASAPRCEPWTEQRRRARRSRTPRGSAPSRRPDRARAARRRSGRTALAGIGQDADAEADVAGLRYPEDQPADAPASEVERLPRDPGRWSRRRSPSSTAGRWPRTRRWPAGGRARPSVRASGPAGKSPSTASSPRALRTGAPAGRGCRSAARGTRGRSSCRATPRRPGRAGSPGRRPG